VLALDLQSNCVCACACVCTCSAEQVIADAEMIIDIFDDDVGMDDEFMGRVRLKLSDMKTEWTDQWYEIDVGSRVGNSIVVPYLLRQEARPTY
jgi:hypothetical protein